MRVMWAAATHVGARENQQDALLADGWVSVRDGYRSGGKVLASAEHLVFGVFDGMGGHAGGDIASRLGASVVGAADPGTSEALVAAIVRADRTVSTAGQLPGLAGLGSTAATVLVSDGHYIVATVGDSFVFRRAFDVVGSIGARDTVETAFGPRITQCLGWGCEPHADTYEVGVPVRLLLCSDGLGDYASTTQIETGLAEPALERSAGYLMDAALRAGAPDNVALLVIDLVM